MLPAGVRMRESGEFAATVRRGRREGARTIVLHFWCPADPYDESPRVGFVVSKKVGPAVVRNRVKRRLRHLVRRRVEDPDAGLPSNLHVVVRALPAAAADPQRLDRDMAQLWARAARKWATPISTSLTPESLGSRQPADGPGAGDRS